jgi:hypothetical protein
MSQKYIAAYSHRMFGKGQKSDQSTEEIVEKVAELAKYCNDITLFESMYASGFASRLLANSFSQETEESMLNALKQVLR